MELHFIVLLFEEHLLDQEDVELLLPVRRNQHHVVRVTHLLSEGVGPFSMPILPSPLVVSYFGFL